MDELFRLPLETVDGRPLRHKFYRQTEDPIGLLVTFPGNHYGVDGPLLYYPSETLWTNGWDTLALTYGFQSAAMEFRPDLMLDTIQECQSALKVVLAEREYPRIGLIGKSLGAMLVAQLCSTETELASALAVYLTPPLTMPFFNQLLKQTTQPAHFAIGVEDRFYSADALEQLRLSKPFSLTLIERADHSMNIEGDLDATIEALKKVVQDVVEYLGR